MESLEHSLGKLGQGPPTCQGQVLIGMQTRPMIDNSYPVIYEEKMINRQTEQTLVIKIINPIHSPELHLHLLCVTTLTASENWVLSFIQAPLSRLNFQASAVQDGSHGCAGANELGEAETTYVLTGLHGVT